MSRPHTWILVGTARIGGYCEAHPSSLPRAVVSPPCRQAPRAPLQAAPPVRSEARSISWKCVFVNSAKNMFETETGLGTTPTPARGHPRSNLCFFSASTMRSLRYESIEARWVHLHPPEFDTWGSCAAMFRDAYSPFPLTFKSTVRVFSRYFY